MSGDAFLAVDEARAAASLPAPPPLPQGPLGRACVLPQERSNSAACSYRTQESDKLCVISKGSVGFQVHSNCYIFFQTRYYYFLYRTRYFFLNLLRWKSSRDMLSTHKSKHIRRPGARGQAKGGGAVNSIVWHCSSCCQR